MDQQQQKPLGQIEVVLLQSEIKKRKDQIDDHFASLNKHGVWLFLATLGCWSVEVGWYRNVAFGIAFILFFWLFFNEKKIKGGLNTYLDKLRTEIEHALPYCKERTDLVAQVDSLKSERLTSPKLVWQAGPFFLCWLFSCFSFLRVFGLY